MVNSMYNGWRMEQVWLDRQTPYSRSFSADRRPATGMTVDFGILSVLAPFPGVHSSGIPALRRPAK
jgi:hypothetical protein